MTPLEIAREIFGQRYSDEYLGHIIWEETGFPHFFDTEDGKYTPEEVFRRQLLEAKEKRDCGGDGMKERPILMSGPMARATREGIKTHTRRVIPRKYTDWIDPPRGPEDVAAGYPFVCGFDGDEECISAVQLCSYGKPGDRLWVKETYRHWHESDFECCGCEPEYCRHCSKKPETPVCYAADHDGYIDPEARCLYGIKWTPSIFMPRKYSRIILEITDIRVERLQSITEEGAIAEGIEQGPVYRSGDELAYRNYLHKDPLMKNFCLSPVASFQTLWNFLNGKTPGASWEADPWVWVIGFKHLNAGVVDPGKKQGVAA